MVDVSAKAKIKWHGKWIWANYITSKRSGNISRPSEPVEIRNDERNVFVLARKRFRLEKKPHHAIMNISVDSGYKLFINGKYIGRGLNRCEAYYWYYNTYDITDYLQPGENVIAIHARYYGIELAYYTPPGSPGRDRTNSGKGGLLFEIGLSDDDSRTYQTWIGSDESTKVIRNLAERNDVPLKNDALGFVEEFDSRKMLKAWNHVDFDDSGWENAFILDYPIKTLLLDKNAPLYEEIVFPSQVIDVGETDDIHFTGEYSEAELTEMDFCIQNMLEAEIKPLNTITVKNVEALLGKDGVCEIIPKRGGKAVSIMLQFEKEVVGYPRIVVDGPAGTIIDIISSEKFRDGRLALDFLNTKRGSRLILREGRQFFEQWNWEGFQYTQLKIRKLSGPVKIYSFATNMTSMRVSKLGKFECDDENLNKLWLACGYTLRCCAIDAYLDCPSREQRAYLGDAYPEALVATACFGEARLTKKLIYDTAYGQRADGITYSFHPGDAVGQCHIIPDYCFYWIQITWDYWRYYRDEKALFDLYPHFIRAIEWFWKYIDPDVGLIGSDLPYWKFIDWSFPHEKPGFNAIINTQFVDILRIVANIAEKLEDSVVAYNLREQAQKMLEIIDRLFWDSSRGCYCDYVLNGTPSKTISQQTNAYLVLKGIAPKNKWYSILNTLFASEKARNYTIKCIQNPSNRHKPEEEQLFIIAQPFFMHHVHQFLAMMGRFDIILEYMRLGWVPMITKGKTGTIWETWSQDGSECHAWCTTPAYDLSTHWLGIKPASPGFETVEISPTFMGLNQVSGIFPSIRGSIEVSWKKTPINEGVQIDIKVVIPPQITKGFFIIPALDGKVTQKITTNVIDSTVYSQNSNISKYELPPGTSEFHLIY